jgi:hypothetical protein
MPNRIDATLDQLNQAWFLGTQAPHYRRLIENALRTFAPAQLAMIDKALSLGERDDKPSPFSLNRATSGQNAHETQRRHAVRACLLAEFAIKNRRTDLADPFIGRFESLATNQLVTQFKMLFPLVSDGGNRREWGQGFTNPQNHNSTNFRYIVHALRLAEGPPPGAQATWTPANSILNNPNETLEGWSAISCSVIDQSHPSTFRSAGLILDVPPENILTTSPGDQFFPNRTGMVMPPWAHTPALRLEANGELLTSIQQIDNEYGGVRTPSEILARTGSNTQYNEIVVCGSSHFIALPGANKSVKVTGLFLKESEAQTQIHLELGAAAQRLRIPLILI